MLFRSISGDLLKKDSGLVRTLPEAEYAKHSSSGYGNVIRPLTDIDNLLKRGYHVQSLHGFLGYPGSYYPPLFERESFNEDKQVTPQQAEADRINTIRGHLPEELLRFLVKYSKEIGLNIDEIKFFTDYLNAIPPDASQLTESQAEKIAKSIFAKYSDNTNIDSMKWLHYSGPDQIGRAHV